MCFTAGILGASGVMRSKNVVSGQRTGISDELGNSNDVAPPSEFVSRFTLSAGPETALWHRSWQGHRPMPRANRGFCDVNAFNGIYPFLVLANMVLVDSCMVLLYR